MKITPCNSYSFGQNYQKKEFDNSKHWALGALSYATVCAVFPHDYEKMIDKIDINFKNLPLQDKAKNVAKFAVPFFGYPLLTLIGLKLMVDGINKLTNKTEINQQ